MTENLQRMDLRLDKCGLESYHSGTQIARVLTENWVSRNLYCPRCGNPQIRHFENNRPVADFYCPSCRNEFELKSKIGRLGKKINDGAYDTMIQRITSNDNPDFLFMSYSKENMAVTDLVLIPKHFFVPDMIEKRKPLSDTARRAGWVGCNILIEKIPEQGKIEIITNGNLADSDDVVSKVNRSNKLETNDINRRGWIMDILHCVNAVSNSVFSLKEIYAFENWLQMRHPQNKNIRAKIRQQLQLLRDKGFIAFLGNGIYKKVNG